MSGNKTLKLKPNIAKHDLDRKIEQAKKFLNKGLGVDVIMVMRGREINNAHIGMDLMKAVSEELEGLGNIFFKEKVEGPNIIIKARPF